MEFGLFFWVFGNVKREILGCFRIQICYEIVLLFAGPKVLEIS